MKLHTAEETRQMMHKQRIITALGEENCSIMESAMKYAISNGHDNVYMELKNVDPNEFVESLSSIGYETEVIIKKGVTQLTLYWDI